MAFFFWRSFGNSSFGVFVSGDSFILIFITNKIVNL